MNYRLYMRILIDCTHTATYPFKNTGIHRVVRQIANELLLTKPLQDFEIVLVKFDGYKLIQVDDLNNKIEKKHNKFSDYTALITRLSTFFKKAKNKISRLIPASFFNRRISKVDKFMKRTFSSNDIYLIADANWDLPGSYYIFLKKLKSYGVSINIICYDLIPIKFPEYCSNEFVKVFKQFYFEYADCFDKVICISEKSAEDYQEILGSYQREDQVVTHFKLGCDYIKMEPLENLDLELIRPEIRKILGYQFILVGGSIVTGKQIGRAHV